MKKKTARTNSRPLRPIALASSARQRGQAMVEYLVGTVFVVLAIGFVADPSLFGVTRDLLVAIKDYFKAFAYAISVAAT